MGSSSTRKLASGGGQPGQGRAAPLAAAEAADLLQRPLAGERQNAASRSRRCCLVQVFVRRPDGVDHRPVVVQPGQLLIEVADGHALAEADSALRRARSGPSRQRSNVVLPQPLGPSRAQRWPRTMSRFTSANNGRS